MSQNTRYIDPILVQCWPTVRDAGPTLNRPRVNVFVILYLRTKLATSNYCLYLRPSKVHDMCRKCFENDKKHFGIEQVMVIHLQITHSNIHLKYL